MYYENPYFILECIGASFCLVMSGRCWLKKDYERAGAYLTGAIFFLIGADSHREFG